MDDDHWKQQEAERRRMARLFDEEVAGRTRLVTGNISCDELAAEVLKLRPIITNILGFHELTQNEKATREKRDTYREHVYSGGVELAEQVFSLANKLIGSPLP